MWLADLWRSAFPPDQFQVPPDTLDRDVRTAELKARYDLIEEKRVKARETMWQKGWNSL